MQAEPPAAEVFTDYSQWERRPCTKSWTTTSGGWSTTGRGRVGLGKTTHSKTCRQDALKHRSVFQCPHSSHCGHKKTLAQPRQISTCITSPRRKIEKAKSSTVTARHSMNQMQLKVRQKSVQEFRQYKDDLLAANLELIGTIRKGEDEKNAVVQELLEKYRKSRGSVAALKKKTHRDTKEIQTELERTRQWVLQKENELHEELRETELLLQAKIKERDILKSFKEKKFMVNQATIDQLRDEMRTHAHLSKERIAGLEAEMAEERHKCQRMVDQIRREIEAQATEKCIDVMKRSVKEKGIQNRIMEKEIELHRYKAETMRQSMQDLRERISQLKVEVEVDKARVRPLVLLEKCLPDTELHLNIPVQDS
ncbi:hypothetical protein GBAR_LOCUS18417 [Geodia barretti]|uniref:Uncharacterized protein n=1 Tax=Geodia barretti TaxID=519541 RepID=A0AA35SN31_GEOBA|nr:hypothetical protein GBAR_LOCUS18417 [Geodia barretti]